MSRLLTPYGIESLAANPNARNPSIGKGAAIRKLLDYYPDKGIVVPTIRMFHRNMGSLLSRDPMVFMPGSLGGHDCPHEITTDDLWERFTDSVPNVIYPLFNILVSKLRTPLWLEYLLRRCRVGISPKGIENPTLDPLIRSYEVALTSNAGVPSKSWEELMDMTRKFFVENDRDPSLIIARDVRRTAKVNNLMNGFDFAELVDRSSAIRIFFLVAMDIIPLDRALPQREEALTPSRVLERFQNSEISSRIKYDYEGYYKDFWTEDFWQEGYLKLKSWYQGGMAELNKDFGSVYLSKDSYRDSLNGMRVQLWHLNDFSHGPFIKGTYSDPFRQLDQDQYIGTVVSLNRLN